MKVLIHREHGAFHLSDAVLRTFAERKGWHYQELKGAMPFTNAYAVVSDKPLASVDEWNAAAENGITVVSTYSRDIELRTDPDLIAAVEENDTALEVVEIPDDVEWEIAEYDGAEWIAEKHRTW